MTLSRVSFFWMTMNRHSCLFFAEGASRPASMMRSIWSLSRGCEVGPDAPPLEDFRQDFHMDAADDSGNRGAYQALARTSIDRRFPFSYASRRMIAAFL